MESDLFNSGHLMFCPKFD